MRFECDSCHAKYKISDDKVRGRVVRFPCRKCDHKILIDGRHDADVTVPAGAAYKFEEVTRKSEPVSQYSQHEAATARARRPSTPARRRPPSVPPRRPAAASRRVSSMPASASTALVGQHPGLAPPVPAALGAEPANETSQRPEWHVSINDVPVGPIRLEEMGHKIDAGAVSEYSLVWRDGFAEWRPLATVPELMALLHERRHSGPPSRSSFSSMPPFVETRPSLDEPSPPPAVPAPPSSFPSSSALPGGDDEIAPLADALQPEGLGGVSQPPAPIGPDGVFQSSPQLGSYSGLPPSLDDEVSIPSTPPAAVVLETAPVEPEDQPGKDRRLSLGVLAFIIAVAVFSGVIAFLVFERFGDELMAKLVGKDAPAKVVEPPRAAPAPVPEAEPESVVEEEELAAEPADAVPADAVSAEGEAVAADAESQPVEEEESSDAQEAAPELGEEPATAEPATQPTARARRKPRSAPAAATAAPAEEEISAEDQKLLDEFGSGADSAPAKIAVKESGSTQSKKPPLDGDAVRATVTANKPRLQRCYERAIRGQQSPPAVRLDVTVTVAASGRVKKVTSEGDGPGGLAACIEASVRRWRFPDSAEGGPAKFPIVFSAN